MGDFAVGQAVPRFEDPRLLARRRALCRRHGAAAHGLRPCAALAPRPRAHPQGRRGPGQGGAGGAGGTDRGGLASFGLGRPAEPERAQVARRLAFVPTALSGPGQGPGALGRRLCRLCRGLDQRPGGRRGRTDRGRLRAVAGDRLDRRRRRARMHRWSGRRPRATSPSFMPRAMRRRPTPPLPRPRMSCAAVS